jgi:hypothetical protein
MNKLIYTSISTLLRKHLQKTTKAKQTLKIIHVIFGWQEKSLIFVTLQSSDKNLDSSNNELSSLSSILFSMETSTVPLVANVGEAQFFLKRKKCNLLKELAHTYSLYIPTYVKS